MTTAVTILVIPLVLGTAAGFILPKSTPPGWFGMMAVLATVMTGLLMSLSTGLLVALFAVGMAVGRSLSRRRRSAAAP